MLSRVLEPEVMDTAEEAVEYDAMDHQAVNQKFVADLLAVVNAQPQRPAWRVFDAGTGTALIPIELLRAGCPATVVAADAAAEMLKVAERNVVAAGLQQQITLVERDCKQLPEASGSFDVVMSNTIVHHIPEPLTVLAECARMVAPGGVLFVRDLCRPESDAAVESLVATYAGNGTKLHQQLLRQSLYASLTVEEVRELLQQVGLPGEWVSMTSDRHWTISGVVGTPVGPV